MLFSKSNAKDDTYSAETFSLEGEDRIIYRYFKEKKSGFYIDIGANKYDRYNNTYLFYKNGWTGLNIDADEDCINELNSKRPKDINVNSAVGNPSGGNYFFVFNDSALNTFSEKLANTYVKSGYRIERKLKLEKKTLKFLLEKYVPKGTTIDFLNLDIEGGELEALQSNDWDKFRPELIVVEILEAREIKDALKHPITEYLKKLKYSFISKTLTNCIYRQ